VGGGGKVGLSFDYSMKQR